MDIPEFVNLCVMAMAAMAMVMAMATLNAHATGWDLARATFYGDMSGSETMRGACGYGDLIKQGYGLETAALSTALFKDGLTCGACFQLQCTIARQWCLPGIITITATNFCPPNYSKTHDIWCNPPQKHFDLSLPMFLKIAKYKAGVVPVLYRRVPCIRRGGLHFQITGNRYYMFVLVFNVGGAGDVVNMKVKGTDAGWVQMTRNWGQNWQAGQNLVGQGLSFQVTTSDGRMVQSDDVVPRNWRFGQSYAARNNFRW